MFAASSSRLASQAMLRTSRRTLGRRVLSTNVKEESKGWWSSAQFWGGLGAIAGWGMSGSAIYDAMQQGPEVISLTMTPVLIVYSTLFASWAWIVQPRNMLLCACVRFFLKETFDDT